jgi:hypothetical protein
MSPDEDWLSFMILVDIELLKGELSIFLDLGTMSVLILK